MGRWEFDESDDDFDDPVDDAPDDDADEEDLLPCPACGASIWAEADVCPKCGEFILRDRPASPWEGKPVWWILLGLAGIVAVVATLAFLFMV